MSKQLVPSHLLVPAGTGSLGFVLNDDHFNAEAVAKHLRNNPEARFVSTRQAVEKLRRVDDFDEFRDRVSGFWPAEGTR